MIVADSLAPTAAENSSKNEESDYTYRRKSMDEFIKRILAEAREEQQKRMQSAGTSNNSDAAATNHFDQEQTTTNDSYQVSVIGCLYVQQTFSKRPALARVF